ncbi:cell separation during budding [Dissophora globulifera]|nr:cell separation during budding [Dissophora globulifera]
MSSDRVLPNQRQHREGLTTATRDWTMVKAGTLVEKQTLVTIDADTTVEDACEVLLQNGITSAPVYDSAKKMYVGMFDYGDLMTYILLLLKKMDVPLGDQTMEMRDLIQLTSKSQNVPVKLASGTNGVSSLAVLDDQGVLLGNISLTDIKDQYPILDVNVKSTFGYTLSKLQATKAHRMWVVNDGGCAVGVVSLTDVFRVLSGLIDA